MKYVSLWDRIGIGISGLCAVHCLFFPVTLALLPLWPFAEVVHRWSHPVLFILIVPTVLFAVRKHSKTFLIPMLLYSGLSVVGLAWLLHDWIGAWGEAFMTLIGSILLISGHWRNYRHHQKQKHKHYETA